MEGFIALHRKITENEFYFSERFTRTQAWIDLLILANHKPQTVYLRGVETSIDRGQLCWAKTSLAKRWRWNERTVTSFLSTLQNRKMIQSNSTNVTTVITILNYDDYQLSTEPKGKKAQSKVQNKVQSKVQTDNNVKNVKNEKKKHNKGIDEIDIPSLIDEFPNVEVEHEFKKFKYYLGSNERTYKNYVMAFKNWLSSDWVRRKEKNTFSETMKRVKKRKGLL